MFFFEFVWQISSFRESKSDDRKFYIFTATKTLHLRTNSKRDRAAWLQALASTRSLFPLRSLNDNLSLVQTDLSISTERLKSRLLEEGTSENTVKDCEQIMLSEFSQLQGQLKVLCEERSNLFDTLRQLEVTSSQPFVHFLKVKGLSLSQRITQTQLQFSEGYLICIPERFLMRYLFM